MYPAAEDAEVGVDAHVAARAPERTPHPPVPAAEMPSSAGPETLHSPHRAGTFAPLATPHELQMIRVQAVQTLCALRVQWSRGHGCSKRDSQCFSPCCSR